MNTGIDLFCSMFDESHSEKGTKDLNCCREKIEDSSIFDWTNEVSIFA